MSADKLVFDLSQEIEGQPQIFVKKDWLNILDNMNQNYSANQTIIDTSQLSNSNKWMNYREAYLSIPLTMCLTGNGYTASALGALQPQGFQPASQVGGASLAYYQPTSADYVMGLRNWFGTIVHSFTLDMNGTTIIQQTPFINMINSFRLLTSLSWGDVLANGSVIGYYPDTATAYSLNGARLAATTTTGAPEGQGVCNNTLYPGSVPYIPQAADSAFFAQYDKNAGNMGLVKRIQMINLDPDGAVGGNGPYAGNIGSNGLPTFTSTNTYSGLMTGSGVGSSTAFQQLWLSHISSKVNGVVGQLNSSQLVISICATVYLKHLHNFFAMIPLLKGTFFKMTAFLNNASTQFTVASKVVSNDAATGLFTAATRPGQLSVQSVNCPVGGTNPLMISSAGLINGGSDGLGNGVYTASVQVGSRCLNQVQVSAGVQQGVLSPSIYLYVPAYTFNAPFERSYLSSPVKSIKYSDYYQYQVLGVGSGTNFNNLLTNGIANIKSVLIIPYYSSSSTNGAIGSAGAGSGLPSGVPVYESPFDTAGSGTTSPMCLFSNFNVVISGANTIYNTQFRAMEQFNNQLKGCNSVNGDMTDGLTSGLLSSLGFQASQCFWYVNVSRQLPVEEQVPKSVQIIGQNLSAFALDLFCFIEYGVAVDVDALTGARV